MKRLIVSATAAPAAVISPPPAIVPLSAKPYPAGDGTTPPPYSGSHLIPTTHKIPGSQNLSRSYRTPRTPQLPPDGPNDNTTQIAAADDVPFQT